jgi:hypothetical protein
MALIANISLGAFRFAGTKQNMFFGLQALFVESIPIAQLTMVCRDSTGLTRPGQVAWSRNLLAGDSSTGMRSSS